jgi:hypothetical protein
MAFPTDWLYRKAFTLSHAGAAVTAYQVRVLVGESSGAAGEEVDCGGLCKTDFADLRFTNAAGTALDYWIESVTGATPNQLATIWIECDSIETGATTFYMYYGKSDATAVTNGDATFLFFDDFNDASVDSAKWTNTGNHTESGGTLNKTANNQNQGFPVIGKTNIAHPCVLRAKEKAGSDWSTADAAWAVVVAWDTAWATQGYLGGHYYLNAGTDYWGLYGTVGPTFNSTNESMVADTYYLLDLKIHATKQYLFVDNVQKGVITTAAPAASKPMFLTHSSSSTSNYTTYYDYVFARKWVTDETEPANGGWGAREDLAAAGGVVPVMFAQYRRRWAA